MAVPIYTEHQKKLIRHYFGHLWKKELRNENNYILYTYFNNQINMKLLNNVTVLLKPAHDVCQGLNNGSFLKNDKFHTIVHLVLI